MRKLDKLKSRLNKHQQMKRKEKIARKKKGRNAKMPTLIIPCDDKQIAESKLLVKGNKNYEILS